jgi:hypothetical protein
VFIVRVIGIVEDARQRIGKYRQCFLEPDSVLLDVLAFFRRIPLESWSRHRKITGAATTRSTRPGRAVVRLTAMPYPPSSHRDHCTAFTSSPQTKRLTPSPVHSSAITQMPEQALRAGGVHARKALRNAGSERTRRAWTPPSTARCWNA